MRGTLIWVFIGFMTFVGCNNIKPSPETTTAEGKELKINGPLLARVNDWVIGLDDFKNYLNSLKPLARSNNLDIDSLEFKKRFLNDLVKAQILAQIALDRGLDKKEDMVRALRDTRDTLLAAKIRDEIEKNTYVSSTEVQSFYDKNKHLLKKPQEVRVSEIVVSSESQAKEILIKLLQGESFEGAARQYSIASSKDNGGDKGWLSPTQEDLKKNRSFWEAVATLKKGDTPRLFRGEDGYCIIKVEDIRGGQEITFSEVEKELEKALKEEKIFNEENKLIAKFKAKARVAVSEDLIK
ncbi:MAG: peptidyl-prolyl cis-trans isomerase [Candidatus Omnitrophota bacterium]|nr:peptidyl-prolyl cis-trans isomerase [Candidatus Omnitrophota bacterium]